MLQAQRKSTDYPRIVEMILPKLKTIGFGKFKADLPEYPDPKKFSLQGSEDVTYTPDISGMRGEKKGYFEISSRKADKQRLISKWKLLSKLSAHSGGFFAIVTPRGTIKFTKDLVEQHKIEAKLIRV